MIPAESANRIDYSVYLPEWHPIHLPVQLFKIRLYLLVVVGIILIETFIQNSQDRIRITIIGGIIGNLLFQFLNIGIHCIVPGFAVRF